MSTKQTFSHRSLYSIQIVYCTKAIKNALKQTDQKINAIQKHDKKISVLQACARA